jgi:hypothetical protein
MNPRTALLVLLIGVLTAAIAFAEGGITKGA